MCLKEQLMCVGVCIRDGARGLKEEVDRWWEAVAYSRRKEPDISIRSWWRPHKVIRKVNIY